MTALQPAADLTAGSAAALVWLLPVLPFAGFLVNGGLALAGARRSAGVPAVSAEGDHAADAAPHEAPKTLPSGVPGIIGTLAVLASFVIAVMCFGALRGTDAAFVQTYGAWMPSGSLRVDWAFQLDHLSSLMTLVITGVGTLIHVFSIGYMRNDASYARYFAYLNLFVAFMLVLVLGASYPVLFLGWEGVGLASYLLIGFWYGVAANTAAGRKAFIVNRVGDFGLLIAMFMLFANVGALDFATVAARAATLPAGGAVITAICLFLFLACAGKSAQLPLYMWLPDAMAGPTPVSALIHAATMVTAGVYLVARSSALFALAPVACLVVALIGALTALFAATIGLKQWDIKRVLAYSTVSQLGYMFIGVGVGAYASGIFHLVTHAFFKALLFLGAGAVIHAMHDAFDHAGVHDDAQDMRNMGNLRRKMPLTAALMWIATLAISGIPPLAGFFSKDAILGATFERARGSLLASSSLFGIPGSAILYIVYAIGLITALLTAVYMTRMMLYTFHGEHRSGDAVLDGVHEPGWTMRAPLVVLGVLTLVGGWLNLPEFAASLGRPRLLEEWLAPVVGAADRAILAGGSISAGAERELLITAVLIALAGVVGAFAAFSRVKLVPAKQAPAEVGVQRVLNNAYFVDRAVDRSIVRATTEGGSKVLWKGIDHGLIDRGIIETGTDAVGWLAQVGSWLQGGNVGNYAWAVAAGVLILLGAFTLR